MVKHNQSLRRGSRAPPPPPMVDLHRYSSIDSIYERCLELRERIERAQLEGGVNHEIFLRWKIEYNYLIVKAMMFNDTSSTNADTIRKWDRWRINGTLSARDYITKTSYFFIFKLRKHQEDGVIEMSRWFYPIESYQPLMPVPAPTLIPPTPPPSRKRGAQHYRRNGAGGIRKRHHHHHHKV